MANTIQFRRGTTVPSSGLNAGEPLFKTNDARFYIASGASTANWVGAPILDEDNMASDSAVKLATQQSIKAYVDAQVATHDAFSELVDTNISSPQAGQMAIYDGTNSWDNVSMGGDATMNAAGQVTIANNAISNAKMADDAVNTAEIADSAVTNAKLAGSIANAKLSNSTTTFAGDSGSNQAMALGSTFTLEGTSNEIETTMGTNKVTIGLPSNVTISGNLTVNGTMTTASSQQVELGDVNIMMAKSNSANSVDIGFFGKYVASGTKYKGIFSDQDNSDTWTFFKGTGTEPTSTVDTTASGYALAGIKCASVDGATIDGGTY
tara:strand:- start:743 stop:1708 length:966 start_codon:yes stop_codon:yes gene_type:complete